MKFMTIHNLNLVELRDEPSQTMDFIFLQPFIKVLYNSDFQTFGPETSRDQYYMLTRSSFRLSNIGTDLTRTILVQAGT